VSTTHAPAHPAPADFRARHRGGGLFTETVNQYLGSYLAAAAYRRGLSPTALTLANLVIGLATSLAVVALAGPVAGGRVPALAVGLAALVLWQLAYSLDCADGQLARVSGRSSAAGARVDVLCDVAIQVALVAAVAAVAQAHTPHVPAALAAAFAATWMVNLVTSVMQQGSAGASLVTSASPAVRMVKLVRDYGAVITVVALVLALRPDWAVGLEVAFTAVNGLFLLASIGAAARASLR
jgi:phosphatidylglycerophosphate synthase